MKRNMFRSAALLAVAFIANRIIGFALQIVLAAKYGAGVVTDAFIIADNIPDLLLNMFAVSAAAVFIPLYQRHQGDKNLFTSNVLNLGVIVGFAFAAVFTFFPQALVFMFASRIDRDTFSLASAMTSIMVWSAVPLFAAYFLRSLLQIFNTFFFVQIALTLGKIVVLITVFVSHSTAMPILLSIGAVAGDLLALGILYCFCIRKGYRYRLYVKPREPYVKEMILMLLPVLLASSITEINAVIDRNFASSLASGAISALNYAIKIKTMVTIIFSTTIVTLLFPKMSKYAADGDIETLKRQVGRCIRLMIPILVPATAAIIIAAEPIVAILFERGAFSGEDTLLTMNCLRMYAIGIAAAGTTPLLAKTFHSVRDTVTPAILSALSVVLNIALNVLLIGPLKHMGLALATSLSGIFLLFFLLFFIRKRFGSLGLMAMKAEWLKMLAATAVMSLVVWLGSRLLPIMSGGYMQRVGLFAALSVFGVIVYLLVHGALRSHFISDCISMIHKRKAKNEIPAQL